MKTNAQIPLDLVREILMRLPARSLFRLRCVSKLWLSVIADPRFVGAYHERARAYPKLLIYFFGMEPDGAVMELYSADYPQPQQGRNETNDLTEGRTRCTLVPTHRRLAFCKDPYLAQVGGLCWFDFFDSVRVWNPATHESMDLETAEFDPGTRYIGNLLGFDPVEKKHKLLNIREAEGAVETRVLVLGESCWRRIENQHSPGQYLLGECVSVNGVVFYLSSEFGPRMLFMAFHVRSERLQQIQFPEGADGSHLIELAGQVTLMKNTFHRRNEINLCMLEDLEQKSWRRKSCLIPLEVDGDPLVLQCGTPAGELLLTSRGFKEPFFFFLVLFNVESNLLRRIEFEWSPERTPQLEEHTPIYPMVVFHIESLQSPRGGVLSI